LDFKIRAAFNLEDAFVNYFMSTQALTCIMTYILVSVNRWFVA